MRLDDHEKILASIERNRHWPLALEGVAREVRDLEDAVREREEGPSPLFYEAAAQVQRWVKTLEDLEVKYGK